MSSILSKLDTERFGVRIGKVQDPTKEDLLKLDEKVATERIGMVILRLGTEQHDLIQTAEMQGFRLMDTLVKLRMDLRGAEIPDVDDRIIVRPFKTGETPILTKVARQAFSNWIGHYHADPRLPKDKCTEVYVDMIRRSCDEKDVVDFVFVAETHGEVLCFCTGKITKDKVGEGILAAVGKKGVGLNIYTNLMRYQSRHFKEEGCSSWVGATQVNNYHVQHALINLGLRPFGSEYTFHKWYD